MNQKFIISLSVALMLLVPVHAGARSVKADAGVYQNAPTITVKGVVTDAQGEPLPGASVLIKGTSNGTVTDIDGNYAIAAQQGQTVVVSFIGFKDQEFSVTKAQQNIALESDSTVLDDVVVVGYGSSKRANLTGAVDAVDSKVFENRAFGNVQMMLNGTMPNVDMQETCGQPYQQQDYTVRGPIFSIANTNEGGGDGHSALILIDGVEGDINLLNPNDIESVTVLKDAASAAIYGSRGPAGVILVTTKDPSKTDSKFSINYTGNFNFSVPTVRPDYIEDGLEWSKLALAAYTGYGNAEADFKKLNKIDFSKTSLKTFAGFVNEWAEHPELTGKTTVDSKGKYIYHNAGSNWWDELYKNHVSSQIHNVSISGKSDKLSYILSGRLYNYGGLYQYNPDKYKTMNLRSKVVADVTNWLRVTENISYSYDKVHQPAASSGTDLNSLEDMTRKWGFPFMPVYNEDGTFTQAGASVFGAMMENTSYKDILTKSFGTTTAATAHFFDNSLRFNGDFTYKAKSKEIMKKATSSVFSEMPNVLTQLAGDSNSDLANQYLQRNTTEQNYIAVNAFAEYEKNFNKHYLKVMAGYNYEQKITETTQLWKAGLLDRYSSSFTVAKGFYLGDNSEGIPLYDGKSTTDTGWIKWRTSGFFGRLNYSFDERYLIEFDGRYDGTSKFINKNQWKFFPSVSAGWRVSAEPWWNVSPSAISNLKVRASYGSLGDAASVSSYAFEENLSTKKSKKERLIDALGNTFYYRTIPDATNSDFGWATIETIDFGVDLGFFNGKLNVSYDYFQKNILDQLVETGNYPDTFGAKAPKDNAANMITRGWELVVNYNDHFMVGGKPFHIGFRGTLGDNWTEITKYPNDNASINAGGQYYVGQTLGEIWGFRSNGLFLSENDLKNAFGPGVAYSNAAVKSYKNANTAIGNECYAQIGDIWLIDKNGNNKIDKGAGTVNDPGDMEIIGNKYPRYNYSFTINLDWNNIFLNAAFTGVGHQDWSPTNSVMMGLYAANYYPMSRSIVDNMWSESNPNGFWPRLATGVQYLSGASNVWNNYVSNNPVDRLVFNVGYIRLKNLQVGYNLPKKWLKKIGLSSTKVFFSGENLFTWSPVYKYLKGYDVATITSHMDTNDGLIIAAASMQGAMYPVLKTFSFGVSITY